MKEKVEKEMRQKLKKELKDKNKELKNLTNNQVTNNFGKIIIKNWKTWKTQNKKLNQQKLQNNLKQRIVLGVKIIRRILDHKKWKWQIKYSEKNLIVLFVNLIWFLKQKIN